MPILRSQPQAELLTLLLLHPETEYSITELSVKLGVPLTTVQREVNRFSQAGLINERRVGRTRVASANPAGRYTRPLTELLTVAFGPQVVSGRSSPTFPPPASRFTDRGQRATTASLARLRQTSMFWSSESRPGRTSMTPRSKPSNGSASR